MGVYTERQEELVYRIAHEAWSRPRFTSGLWFHGDIRDNFYYASYLLAASVQKSYSEQIKFDRSAGQQMAEEVLECVLDLQERHRDHTMYGHWPLNLGEEPSKASPHELPVELMGSLMAFLHEKYASFMNEALAEKLKTALEHIYRSGFFRKRLVLCNHHEAKYTAAKLIFGTMFRDEALLEDGKTSLANTIDRMEKEGMSEYGCLPWFWHWIQAFTCALELTEDPAIRQSLRNLLDRLWIIRGSFYLKGAWVGAHSRGWLHDVPRDANVLHDYVQFGDFELPEEMPRTEYAGFLFYEAPAAVEEMAVQREHPAEVRMALNKQVNGEKLRLHSYAYVTKSFGCGGLWERVAEFDNEQVRWMFSLPVRSEKRGNQLYFFHPGEGYDPSGNDPRHQSRWMQPMYSRNTILSIFPFPEDQEHGVIGIIPEGEWLSDANALYGLVEDVLFAVYLNGSYELIPQEGYTQVICDQEVGGVVVEAILLEEAAEWGMASLKAFQAGMTRRRPEFEGGEGMPLKIRYTSKLIGQLLELEEASPGELGARINGERVMLRNYSLGIGMME